MTLPAAGADSSGAGRIPPALEVRTGPQFRLRVYWPNPPELRCPKCGDWHLITPEFWHLNQWSECRTCHAGRVALQNWLRYRSDPAYRKAERARGRRYRQAIAEEAPHLLGVYDRERRAAKADALRRLRARRRAA